MDSSKDHKPLWVAKSLESYENHNLVLDGVVQIFTSGQKLTRKKMKNLLLSEYMTKLQSKGKTKFKVQLMEQMLNQKFKRVNPKEFDVESYTPEGFLENALQSF